MPTLTVLGIHGLGDHRTSSWKEDWEEAIQGAFPEPGVDVDVQFFEYDAIFADVDISFRESMNAVGKLLWSGATTVAGRPRGWFDSLKHQLRWTAGYVVAWVEDEEFRRRVRHELFARIDDVRPDVLLGHSLGSLISYDALSSAEMREEVDAALVDALTYVSFGAQIGNPFVVRNLTPGRIKELPLRQWFHLYNSEDDVFTAPIRMPGVPNFLQVDTFFDVEGWMDHDAVGYLAHPATLSNVWGPLAAEAGGTSGAEAGLTASLRQIEAVEQEPRRPPRRKALLVGINEYPDPQQRLEGCVNDVFLVSAVLQECGFPAEHIRVCLNDRATAQGIRERLDWLLDDAADGDELVFYYSGHGARLPEYNIEEVADHMDETLVAHDFDWTPATSVKDDEIFWMYSQLPYDAAFVMILDCCHSGGMHRQGTPKARGIDPPDDIRHRALAWSPREQMWVPREFAEREAKRGRGGAGYSRLGSAAPILSASKRDERESAVSAAEAETYIPLVLQACQEDEYSYEYRHGVQSYGAFTYAMARTLRASGRITFERLVEETRATLERIGYDQTPEIRGHESWRGSHVPFSMRNTGQW